LLGRKLREIEGASVDGESRARERERAESGWAKQGERRKGRKEGRER